MLLANTPLARWMERNNHSVSSLARVLKVERNRAQHYVHRRAFPTGQVLIDLLELTDLTVADLMPRKPRKKAA